MDSHPDTSERLKRSLRIVNAVFWLAVWAGIVAWSGAYGRWFLMFVQGFVPVMLWGSLHIALRPGGPQA